MNELLNFEMMSFYSFKNLLVWQKAIEFTKIILALTNEIKGHYRLLEQLEAAAASVPQNIAEGKGRVSTKEFIHFLYISRGSLYEAITVVLLLHNINLIDDNKLEELEGLGIEITKMLNSLISKERKKLLAD
ncbi:four helix bundle protein [Saccharicrinis fermentans]|uniref:four helix bundle protein n=1 Tax=Saccharicrinis fermentans TaxID=982 RepID=UPI001FD38F21|nr:four helix bundle protein [Saccharicrinis fermentans]